MDDPLHEFPTNRGVAYSELDAELVQARPAGGFEHISPGLADSCLDATAGINPPGGKLTVEVGSRSPADFHGYRGPFVAKTAVGSGPTGLGASHEVLSYR
jgi:hypothetical protein